MVVFLREKLPLPFPLYSCLLGEWSLGFWKSEKFYCLSEEEVHVEMVFFDEVEVVLVAVNFFRLIPFRLRSHNLNIFIDH